MGSTKYTKFHSFSQRSQQKDLVSQQSLVYMTEMLMNERNPDRNFSDSVSALPAPDAGPSFISEKLQMFFNQYSKIYLLLSECVQLTS